MTFRMRTVVTLEIELDDEAEARRVRDALNVDSDGFADLHLDGTKLEAEAIGEPGTVWRTIDDLLACVSVALGIEEESDALDETTKYE